MLIYSDFKFRNMFHDFTEIRNKMPINSVVVNETRLKNFVNLVNIKKWYGIMEV